MPFKPICGTRRPSARGAADAGEGKTASGVPSLRIYFLLSRLSQWVYQPLTAIAILIYKNMFLMSLRKIIFFNKLCDTT